MRFFIALASFFVVVSGGLILTLEGPNFIPAMADLVPGARGDGNRVLVFLVGSTVGVDTVRRVVDPARIVVSTPEALVLKEGRIVAVNQDAVGQPLVEAGWIDRDIEIFIVGKRDLLPPKGGAEGGAQGIDPERRARLQRLIEQDTLSYGEQLFVLQAVNDGIAF